MKPEIVKEYVDTGKVQLVYKEYPFLGQESTWAAVAAECAADQGKFWEYHDLLFERQQGENQGAYTKDKLIGFGKELGLDTTKFDKCVNEDQTAGRVQADLQEGQQLGVRGTPNFFVNGQPLSGALPFETFKTVIDEALAAGK